ncbi:hypothetical protein MLAC_30990 [Mycobacterium lacus]|uniref:Uncharacterized protein n=1 Tax=Mycobacterium lacus TaxID=169765 RepID=A0A7I7NMC2_9MYCO|nr:hypothetical protein MLAC_30990 [Mycobacterium lacus]
MDGRELVPGVGGFSEHLDRVVGDHGTKHVRGPRESSAATAHLQQDTGADNSRGLIPDCRVRVTSVAFHARRRRSLGRHVSGVERQVNGNRVANTFEYAIFCAGTCVDRREAHK